MRAVSDLNRIELSIVKNHCAGYAKTDDDVILYKLLDLDYGDWVNRVCLYPFCEVVHSNEQVLALTRGFKERS